ncbi:MAG: glycerophosphodiester phosphodiesterase [Clostridia bacterium]|nr:glycerophosphodiester phosphodiesterase [Clostridia bacterium]
MKKDIFVEGHRGYCAKYPENTLISYEGAMDLGVDGFEFDIWLTKDKVPVLMHDGNCKRTCGVDKHLRDMTLAEAKQLDAGYPQKFGDKYIGKGVQVPTLCEMCELVKAKGRTDIVLGVEIKEYTEECVDLSVPILKEYGLFDAACFYAFDAETIKYLKTKYNARVMGYPDFQMKRWFEGAYDYYDEIGLNMNLTRSEVYSVYAAKNMPIHLYCADTDEQVELCFTRKEGVLITANDPVPLMKKLGRKIGETKEF